MLYNVEKEEIPQKYLIKFLDIRRGMNTLGM